MSQRPHSRANAAKRSSRARKRFGFIELWAERREFADQHHVDPREAPLYAAHLFADRVDVVAVIEIELQAGDGEGAQFLGLGLNRPGFGLLQERVPSGAKRIEPERAHHGARGRVSLSMRLLLLDAC